MFSMTLEGGSLWTEDFDEYRKVVVLTFVIQGSQTQVYVRIGLPYAWHVSSQERDQASRMILGYRNYLERDLPLLAKRASEAEVQLDPPLLAKRASEAEVQLV